MTGTISMKSTSVKLITTVMNMVIGKAEETQKEMGTEMEKVMAIRTEREMVNQKSINRLIVIIKAVLPDGFFYLDFDRFFRRDFDLLKMLRPLSSPCLNFFCSSSGR